MHKWLFLAVFMAAAVNTKASDTLYYKGWIALESANFLRPQKYTTDITSKYNATRCRGFIQFRGAINKHAYTQAFFPLGLCDKSLDTLNLIGNNNKYIDFIYGLAKTFGKEFTVKRKISNRIRLELGYTLVNIEMKYIIVKRSVVDKYFNDTNPDESINIEVSFGKIIEIKGAL